MGASVAEAPHNLIPDIETLYSVGRVLFDENGMKATIVWEEGTSTAQEISDANITVENSSSEGRRVSIEYASANGVMINSQAYVSLSPGEKIEHFGDTGFDFNFRGISPFQLSGQKEVQVMDIVFLVESDIEEITPT
jgi:hypothetical protein